MAYVMQSDLVIKRTPYLSIALIVTVTFILLFLTFLSGCTKGADEGKTTIRFVTWKPNQPEVWEEIYETFESEHPDIRLLREVGPHSSTTFHDLLSQKLKNRSRDVDVFFMDVIWPPEFASAGWVMPLDELLSPSEKERFIDGAFMAASYKGKVYGIPLFIDSGMLYYRKDLLKKYGFDPPETWQEMVEQAKRIVEQESKDNKEIFGFSGQFKQYEGLVCNMMEYILSNGGYIINPETGKSDIDKEPAIEAVRFVRDRIIGEIAPVGVLTYEEPESIALFMQGKSVFHRNWPYAWEVSNDPSCSKIAGKVGITKLPRFQGRESCSTLGGWQLGISNYSNNKEAAWTFVRFLTSQRIQKFLALKAGLAPTRYALYKDAEILKAYPQFSDMEDAFLTVYPRPQTPLYPSVSNILQRYFSKAIFNKSSDIEKEAKSASQEINRILSLEKVE